MQIVLKGESKFRTSRNQFAVAPTTSGYQVAYSADGQNWTLDSDAVVPANENLCYIGAVAECFYKLSGNTDQNTVVVL